jgi:hypothetical protein
MIVGSILFGPIISITPRATLSEATRDDCQGLWKFLGLDILTESIELPAPCFNEIELRERNRLRAKNLRGD